MRILLTYDVVDDRRRRRLFRRLRQWLVPVQRSVFEAETDRRAHREALAIVHRELDLAVDDVRVYHLCPTCAARVEHLGVAAAVPDPDEPVVV